jgi:hypothetical protein
MHTTPTTSRADQVRRFVLETIIEPGRAAGKNAITIRAGDVQRGLGWWNRTPSVCSALDAREFQRMSGTRLVERRGPTQSTTAEWVFSLSGGANNPGSQGTPRRLVAIWDGSAFQPCVVPTEIQPGQRVVLEVTPSDDARELAGAFGEFVGGLTPEEGEAMQAAVDEAFETVSDEW